MVRASQGAAAPRTRRIPITGVRYVPVAHLAQVGAERPLCVSVEGEQVLLVRVRNKVVAIANRCPHLGCELDDAVVRAGTIECPGHGWKFDLETGSLARHWWAPPGSHGTRARLTRYRVTLDGTRVLLELPASPDH